MTAKTCGTNQKPVRNAYFAKVVASDHTSLEIQRKVKMRANRQVASSIRISANRRKWKNGYSTMPEMQASPIPAASAITTKRLNAPKRKPPMRLPNRVTSLQKKRKIEGR